jgi:hypothetical protein
MPLARAVRPDYVPRLLPQAEPMTRTSPCRERRSCAGRSGKHGRNGRSIQDLGRSISSLSPGASERPRRSVFDSVSSFPPPCRSPHAAGAAPMPVAPGAPRPHFVRNKGGSNPAGITIRSADGSCQDRAGTSPFERGADRQTLPRPSVIASNRVRNSASARAEPAAAHPAGCRACDRRYNPRRIGSSP